MKKLRLFSWNLENLFDPQSGGPRYDYTPYEGWTQDRYDQKINRIGHILRNFEKQFADMDALFAFQEIENDKVLDDLKRQLGDHYDAVRVDSSFSYLDVGLLYPADRWNILAARYHKVFDRFDKPDILEVQLESRENSSVLTLLLVHLKARPSNKYFTSMYRKAVCDSLQSFVWKKHEGDLLLKTIQRNKDPLFVPPKEYPQRPNIVIMGDFNDDPFSSSLIEYLLASYDAEYVRGNFDPSKVVLYNASWEALSESMPGSNHYENGVHSKWSLLDQIILSPSLLKANNKLCYQKDSFFIHRVNCDEQGVPRRICGWDQEEEIPVWNDEGISDHLPVSVTLNLN